LKINNARMRFSKKSITWSALPAEELANRWPQLSPATILQSPYVLLGTVEQMVEDLQLRRARWGLSSYVIFERDMETFAPVVARLAGR
jgi:hypothetical protein